MSTKELAVLAQPERNNFFGVDKMDNGKIVIFGGGVRLSKSVIRIIGGLESAEEPVKEASQSGQNMVPILE